MKPEKILCALNDIDGQFLREAREEPAASVRPRRRPMTVLIAAVIALMALAVTGFASEEVTGWFRQYFTAQTDSSLSPNQLEYLAENENIVNVSQEQNGYILNLKSILSDENTVYVTLGIAAPEALPFDDLTTISPYGIDFCDPCREPPQAMGLKIVDDKDGLDSTADLVLDFNRASWNEGDLWTLYIKQLCVDVYDKAYEQELLSTKYAGQDNYMFTDEEAAKLHRIVTLAEGPWEFTIDLRKAATQELELITAPVTALSYHGIQPDGTPVWEEVTITSFLLRPLSATVQIDCSETKSIPDFSANGTSPVLVILKDGSSIALIRDWGMTGKSQLKAESPIVLEEVDYILLADGTKLMVP